MNNITNDAFGIPEKETFIALKKILRPGIGGVFKNSISRQKALKTKVLGLHDAKIPNLDFLRFFPNLASLRVNSPVLQNLSGLEATPKLTCIDLVSEWSNGVDLSPLAHCRELREIDIVYKGPYTTETYIQNKFITTGLDSFSKLVQAECLCLSGMGLTDISWIADMENLVDVDLSYNPLCDLTSLQNLRQLRFLELTGCGLTDTAPLGQIATLERVNLEANQIRDFSALANLTALKEITALDNGLTETESEHWQSSFRHIEDIEF